MLFRSYVDTDDACGVALSRPVRALWIEISATFLGMLGNTSRPVRALWIEILRFLPCLLPSLSRPVRALWIEMLM